MSDISIQIGQHIRIFRKKRLMTLDDLAHSICKSKSTVSKYERGEIPMDIETLYEIANALHIHVDQLLYIPEKAHPFSSAGTGSTGSGLSGSGPAFFKDCSQFYSYLFDGRDNQLIQCVFEVQPADGDYECKLRMYMNYKDFSNYQICENTYYGYIEHYDAVTNIQLTNQDSPMEKASAKILASYLDSDTKWGLFTGFSTRPMMPIAAKMLFSRKRLHPDAALAQRLKISREDIRLLRLYNMLSVL